MPNTRTLKTSFVAGEIAPEYFGRLDMPKEQDGLKNCQNFWVLPLGPVQNRPGLHYVNSTKLPTLTSRLIPFIYSNDQSFAMEFGDKYIRLHTSGATLKQNLITNGGFATSIDGWTFPTSNITWEPGRMKFNGKTFNYITNGTFDTNIVGWGSAHTGTASSVTWKSGTAKITQGADGNQSRLFQNYTPLPVSKVYFVTFEITGLPCRVGVGSSDILYENYDQLLPVGKHTITFTSTVADTYVTFYGRTTKGTCYIDNVEMHSTEGYVYQDFDTVTGGIYTLSINIEKPAHVYVETSASAPISDFASVAGLNTHTFTATTASTKVYIFFPSATDYINHVESVSVVNEGDTVPFEVETPYLESDLFDLRYTQSGDIVTLVHHLYPPKELKRWDNSTWTLTDISFASKTVAPASCTAVAAGPGGGTPKDYKYCVTALNSLGYEESLPSPESATVSRDLTITGNHIDISWPAVTDAVRYNIYKYASGTFGYVGQTNALTFTDDNVLADMTKTLPLFDVVFASAGNYPSAVGYHEQRRFFAGTDNEPQNIWGTQSGTESNMNYSVPSKDADALRFRISSQRANLIRHIIALSDMMVMTASSEYRVFTSQNAPMTASTLAIKPQSQNGSSIVSPITVNSAAVYAQAQGGHLRELAYNWQNNGYQSKDLSLLTTHLFDGHRIVDMAYSRTPFQVVWVVNDLGQLLGLTYLPDQEVSAWHKHTTDGFFESICVVTEGIKDVLYAIIRRTINGQIVRYVEMLDQRDLVPLADSFFVDSGYKYQNSLEFTTGIAQSELSRILNNYTGPVVNKASSMVSFSSLYNSAYVGPMTGIATGLDDFLLYRVDVYSTTDADYLQGTSTINEFGVWAITNALTGIKSAKLVRISDSTVITEFYLNTGLVRSYAVPENDPAYPYLKQRCFIYDQAIAIIAAVCNRANDSVLPGFLMDGLIKSLDANGNYACFSVDHKSGVAPDIYLRNGATAWVLYALSFYRTKITDARAATIDSKIDFLFAHILTYKVTTAGSQQDLYRGGTGRYVLDVFEPAYVVTWCSTEHNIDIYFAFKQAGIARANATYTTHANNLGAAINIKLWDNVNTRLYQGMTSSGPDTSDALDCHTWGSLFLRDIGQTAKANYAYNEIPLFKTTYNGINGYKPYIASRGYPSSGDGVWGEGTLGAVLSHSRSGNVASAVDDYLELIQAATNAGLPYSTLRDYVYELSDWFSVASTAWIMIAINPDGVFGATTSIYNEAVSANLASPNPIYIDKPVNTLSGIDWLENKTVSVLADGINHRQLVVTGGTINLDYEASKITLGLPIEAYIETVPLAIQGDASLGQGHIKNVNKVWSRCVGFTGAKAGPDLTRLTTINPLAYEIDGITPKMTNGEVKITIPSNWNPDGSIVIKQDTPRPITICDITIEVAVGG